MGGDWLSEPVRTGRTVLRMPRKADEVGVRELLTKAPVRACLGGVRSSGEIDDAVSAVLEAPTGLFSVEVGHAFAGLITLERRDRDRPDDGSLPDDVLELSYELLPRFWRQGFAEEAASAALGWLSLTLPDELVVVCTQAANERSLRLAGRLGFRHVADFDEFGAEQWLGVRRAHRATG